MQEIRRKNHALTNAQFCVFDLLTLAQFREGRDGVTFADRYLDWHWRAE
jgi:hypothetical protein